MEYYIHLVILVGIYTILAQSYNVAFGLGRLFTLAHVSAYALGAYATALLTTDHGFSFWPALAASVVVPGVLALFVGMIASRLRGDYFAIGTLAFSAGISSLLINWKGLTRGVLGIPGIPRPNLFGFEFIDGQYFLYLVWVIAILVNGVLWFLFASPFGRSLRAVGESDIAAAAMGRDPARIKMLAFIVASCGAGVAGCLFAYYINYIDPSSFSMAEMIFVVTIVVLGRPGSFWGVLLATVFMVLIPEPLRFIDMPSSILGPLRQLLQATILLGVVWWNRDVIFPQERRI